MVLVLEIWGLGFKINMLPFPNNIEKREKILQLWNLDPNPSSTQSIQGFIFFKTFLVCSYNIEFKLDHLHH